MPTLPFRIGRYRVQSVVSPADAVNVVYRAVDGRGRMVAIKTLRTKPADREDLELRLRQEGVLLARLRGRHGVVRLIDRLENPLALVLEFVDGATLAEHLRATGDPGLPLAEAEQVLIGLLDAVGYLHAHSVVHRDIKPGNILLDREGGIRLVDLGVAAHGSPAHALPDDWEEERVGTLAYSAPELIETPQLATNTTVDLYAVGVTAYEMLTGRLPFVPNATESPSEFVRRIRTEWPHPVDAERPRLPASWVDGLTAALAPEPANRVATAEALGVRLGLAVAGRTRQWWRGIRVAAIVAAVLAMGALLLRIF